MSVGRFSCIGPAFMHQGNVWYGSKWVAFCRFRRDIWRKTQHSQVHLGLFGRLGMTEYWDGARRWKTRVLVPCLVTFFWYSCTLENASTDQSLVCLERLKQTWRCIAFRVATFVCVAVALGCCFWFLFCYYLIPPFVFDGNVGMHNP